MSDGEVMERLWSYLRPTGKKTKEMTPAHRVDTETDFLINYGSQFQPFLKVVVVSFSLFEVHLDIVVTFY